MKSTKEKLSNMASAAKEHIDIYKAKIDEKAQVAGARTKEEKVIAHENAKAKEAKAKMELHEAKASHAAEKLSNKHIPVVGTHNQPLGTLPTLGTTHPTYPLGGHFHPKNNNNNI